MQHKVTLVGAGPGDPELLTVKALRAIERADIVVYDRLVSDEIMALIPRGVPKIYAGKSPPLPFPPACGGDKRGGMPQEEINALLVMLAKKYARVVRLKGGDPFLFGRGGEEMLALQQAGVHCEIIPGITSAQGCAAASGIPLTHRGLATGVRFVTGHTAPSPVGGGSGWGHPRSDLANNAPLPASRPFRVEETLVIYMGLTNISEITRNLMDNGLPGSTPAAIIERGTMASQRVFITTLAALPERVKTENIQPPSLIIIGKVTALANEIRHPALVAGSGHNEKKTVTELSHDFAPEYATMNGE